MGFSNINAKPWVSLKSALQDSYIRHKTLITVVSLILSAFVAFLGQSIPGETGLMLASAVCPSFLALLLICKPRISGADWFEGRPADEGLSIALLLYLAPVPLLTIAYYSISPAMAAISKGGIPLTFVVLASSMTVPWLAQAACLPIYRLLGDLIAERNMDAITERFYQFWPMVFIKSLPLIAVFAIPLWIATGWPASAMWEYVVLCVLQLLYVQALVLANVGNRRGLWAIAWLSYSVALFLFPTEWWLPPLAGTATQVFAMRSGLRHLGFAKRLETRVLGADLLRGFLMGAVLWADKYVLLVVTRGQFPIVTVFAAMLPSVITYNFYFVNLAPNVDRSLQRLHSHIAAASISELRESSRRLVSVVGHSVALTGTIAALLTLSVSLVIFGATPLETTLGVTAAIASWTFMMLTLLNYQSDFIGEKFTPQMLGAVHLAVCIVVFAGPSLVGITVGHVGSYMLLGTVEFLLIGVAWLSYKRHWSQPEYTLFWRHANSW